MHPWVAEHWLPLFDRLATEDHLVLDGVFDADILQALETSLHGHLTAGDLHKAGIAGPWPTIRLTRRYGATRYTGWTGDGSRTWSRSSSAWKSCWPC